jgi:hypothetical protein
MALAQWRGHLCGNPANNLINGRGLHGADLAERGEALAQPVVQRVRWPAARPHSHLVTGKSELLREQLADIAGPDESYWAIQASCIRHENQSKGSGFSSRKRRDVTLVSRGDLRDWSPSRSLG